MISLQGFLFASYLSDNKIKRTENHDTTAFRQDNPGTGRGFSMDPLAHEREWISLYNAFRNNPMNCIDPDGALDEPTADNILYLNASKLDFGNISVSNFRNGALKSSPINLLNKGNLRASVQNETLRATVYALGRVDMYLHGSDSGTVSIVNGFNHSQDRTTDYKYW